MAPKIAGGEVQVGVGISEYVGAREDAGMNLPMEKLAEISFLVQMVNVRILIFLRINLVNSLIDSNNSGIEGRAAQPWIKLNFN